MASLWERLTEQSSALSAAQQAQHIAENNAAEREAELLAQLDAASMKLQVPSLSHAYPLHSAGFSVGSLLAAA